MHRTTYLCWSER